MKTIQEHIEEIMARFTDGHRVHEIITTDRVRLRRNLAKAARRRGLLWRFALTDKSVVVAR